MWQSNKGRTNILKESKMRANQSVKFEMNYIFSFLFATFFHIIHMFLSLIVLSSSSSQPWVPLHRHRYHKHDYHCIIFITITVVLWLSLHHYHHFNAYHHYNSIIHCYLLFRLNIWFATYLIFEIKDAEILLLRSYWIIIPYQLFHRITSYLLSTLIIFNHYYKHHLSTIEKWRLNGYTTNCEHPEN